MSKVVKTVARVALPIIGGIVGGPAGAAIGGAIGGAMGGGGVKGAVLGGITGAAGYGAGGSFLGQAASIPTGAVQGAPFYGSGFLGAVTGGGTRALAATASSMASDPTKLLMLAGNQMMGQDNADAAVKAAQIQAGAGKRAINAQRNAQQQQQQTLQPFVDVGTNAASQLATIQADPAGYIQNNPLYTTLANDAQQRLMANAATSGKLAAGGTKAALQDELMKTGNSLLQTQVGNLQTQIGMGGNAAAGVGNGMLATGQNVGNTIQGVGNVQASGVMGEQNAYNNSYNNQINTLLALQGLNKTPIYAPQLSL